MHVWVIVLTLAAVLAVRAFSGTPAPVSVREAPAEIPSSAESRGQLVYGAYGCPLCHGPEGAGGFANPNAETDNKVPAVRYAAEGYTRAELRKLILDGARSIGKRDPQGPRPPFRMPGWRNVMTDPEVDDLVAYVISLYPKSAETKWR